MSKRCPEDKILNPTTGRCVKKDGKIGKSLLKAKGSRKVSRKLSKKASRKVSRKVSKKASRKVSKKASRKVSKKVSKKASRKVSRKVSRKASKKVSRKVSKEASRKFPKIAVKVASIRDIFPKKDVQKILNHLHPDLTIGTDAYQVLLKNISPLYKKSITYLKKGNFQGFFKSLPVELREGALIESDLAIKDVFIRENLNTYILGKKWNENYPEFSKDINYGIASAFEYLLAEILEESGDIAKESGAEINQQKDMIRSGDILEAISQDKVLYKLLH